jgi:alcohol dehydrogenase
VDLEIAVGAIGEQLISARPEVGETGDELPGAPTTLHLEELWIKNITITTGLVDGTTVPMLLQLVQSGKVAGELFGTHEFRLHDMVSAYETFANAAETNALKVVIKR